MNHLNRVTAGSNCSCKSELVILVTGYLDSLNVQPLSQSEQKRFIATCRALKSLSQNSHGIRILLAFTGDATSFNRLILDCNWPQKDAAHFEQTAAAMPFGKGLLEHQLITRALHHWKFVDQDFKVIKLTAKYTVENISDVIHFSLTCNLPLYGWVHIGKKMVDTRCFYFRSKSYESFRYLMDQIDDRNHYYIEHAVYDVLLRLRITPGVLRFRPIIRGFSGSTGIDVRMSRIKSFLFKISSLSCSKII